MDYAVVAFPAAPIRRKPRHSSEMVNQLLFGETVKVLKQRNELWVKISSLHDEYEGWVTTTLVQEIDEESASKRSNYATGEMISSLSIGDRKLLIPVGSSLPEFEHGNGVIANEKFSYSGKVIQRNDRNLNSAVLRELTMPWLNAPYLWGGRTPLGVDCSGFVQVVYKLMGIDLPRDAWQQAQEGKAVKKFSEVQPGDLAFFDNKEDIVHVGILLGDGQMIHASGKVKIDNITKKGVYHPETGKKILRLEAIRRI